eukprot:SAG31_NODE_258_length_18937_cov_61.688555_13_plen_115_part_00
MCWQHGDQTNILQQVQSQRHMLAGRSSRHHVDILASDFDYAKHPNFTNVELKRKSRSSQLLTHGRGASKVVACNCCHTLARGFSSDQQSPQQRNSVVDEKSSRATDKYFRFSMM